MHSWRTPQLTNGPQDLFCGAGLVFWCIAGGDLLRKARQPFGPQRIRNVGEGGHQNDVVKAHCDVPIELLADGARRPDETHIDEGIEVVRISKEDPTLMHLSEGLVVGDVAVSGRIVSVVLDLHIEPARHALPS